VAMPCCGDQQRPVERRDGGCFHSLRLCWQRLRKPATAARLPPEAWTAAAERISKDAQREAVLLLGKGKLFRNGYDDGHSPVSACEKSLAAYVGLKYCVALTSYTSALFVALKSVGVRSGARVLVSSLAPEAALCAVHEAGGECVFVRNTEDIALDVCDLASKADSTCAHFLLLSHVFGQMADLDEILDQCTRRGIRIVEDCADALGAWWDGVHVGHHGLVGCFSAQPCSLVAAGEGGFAVTDDVRIAACIAAMAGCYDQSFKSHFASPESPVFRAIAQGGCPNYSLQMSNITAAALRPQLAALELRTKEAIRKHRRLADRFATQVNGLLRGGVRLRLPEVHPKARPCSRKFLFLAELAPEASARLLAAARARGVPLEGGGQGAPTDATLHGLLFHVCLPPRLSDADCAHAAAVLAAVLAETAVAEPLGAGRDVVVPGPAPAPPVSEPVEAWRRLMEGRRKGRRHELATPPYTPMGSVVIESKCLTPAGSSRLMPVWPPEGPAVSVLAAVQNHPPTRSAGSSVALSAIPQSAARTASTTISPRVRAVWVPDDASSLAAASAPSMYCVTGPGNRSNGASKQCGGTHVHRSVPGTPVIGPRRPSRSAASTGEPDSSFDDSPWSSNMSRAQAIPYSHAHSNKLALGTQIISTQSSASNAATLQSLAYPISARESRDVNMRGAKAAREGRWTARVCSSWMHQAQRSAHDDTGNQDQTQLVSSGSEETLAPVPARVIGSSRIVPQTSQSSHAERIRPSGVARPLSGNARSDVVRQACIPLTRRPLGPSHTAGSASWEPPATAGRPLGVSRHTARRAQQPLRQPTAAASALRGQRLAQTLRLTGRGVTAEGGFPIP